MEYRISTILDQNGLPFVEAPNGGIDFGHITVEQKLTPAPIRLSIGDRSNGLMHIEIRPGNQIRMAGFESVVAFIAYVAQNYNCIKKGNTYKSIANEESQTYLVQLADEHNNMLWVQLSKDDTYWNVNSVCVLSKRYGRNKENIWSASELQNEEPASSNTSQPAINADKEAQAPTVLYPMFPAAKIQLFQNMQASFNKIHHKISSPCQKLLLLYL